MEVVAFKADVLAVEAGSIFQGRGRRADTPMTNATVADIRRGAGYEPGQNTGEGRMTATIKRATAERKQSIEDLRERFAPGTKLYTILRHRSASGMYRVIDVYQIKDDVPLRYTWSVASATGLRYDTRHEGLGVHGCGTDVGFDAIYELSHVLYPDGFTCIGEGCPSNDHSNGDRDYSPHHHKSGGYALRQHWIG